MNRYEKVFNHLKGKREEDLRICKRESCACNGCAGIVDGKRVSEYELGIFKSGEMELIIKPQ